MYRLGLCYEQGCGVEKDMKRAFEWYEKAANRDHSRAQVSVSWFYENAHGGVERSQPQCLAWLTKSADLNDDEGVYRLGRCYANGIGCKANHGNQLTHSYLFGRSFVHSFIHCI
jgi:TPR repeat protein